MSESNVSASRPAAPSVSPQRPLGKQESPPPPAEDRVPVSEKMAYGATSLGGPLMGGCDNQLLLPVFVNVLHISPALMSSLEVFYRIWDAAVDLLVGWLSDRTRSRWGRRRPYILIGFIMMAVLTPAFWVFNPGWSTPTIIAWMIGGQLLLILSVSMWNIPYQSLLFEMTPNSVERTNVVAVRSYFNKVAQFGMSWVWWLTQLSLFHGADGKPDTLRGAFWVCVGFGVIGLACGLLTFWKCKERLYKTAARGEKVPFIKNIKLTLANRPFQLLFVILLLFVLGTKVYESLYFYVNLYYVCRGDTQLASAIAGVGGTVQLVLGIAGIPLTQWCTRRFGKRATLAGILVVICVTGVSTWFTFTPDSPYLSLLSGILASPAMMGFWIVVPSLTGDVVDDDELNNGLRREGAFAAMFSWAFKLSISVSSISVGAVILWSGFEVKLGAAQPDEVFTRVRLFLLLTAGIFVGTAALLCARYPLTTQRINQTRALLEARRGAL